MKSKACGFSAWSFTLFFAALFALPVTSAAQNFRGQISGSVTDPSGAVVPNAAVSAVATGTGVTYNTVSSSAGQFQFPDLPLGSYNLTITASGFTVFKVSDVPVSAGVTYNVPVKLSVGRQSSSVEVSAEALSLDTSSTVLATVLPTEAVEDIPRNGRDYSQDILLIPSSNIAGGSGLTSINGLRSNSVNWEIEGTDDNDAWWNMPAANESGVSAIAGTLIPMDAIDEFSFVSSTSGEAGRNPTGTANVVIKSGTNQFHGTAYYFNRNEALAANSPFATPGSRKNRIRDLNDGFSLGGPIWRNKTFFFTSLEYQGFEIGNQSRSTEPSAVYQTEAQGLLRYYGVPVNPLSTSLLTNLWPANALTGPAAVANYLNTALEQGHSYNGVIKIDENFTDKDHLSAKWYAGQGPQRQPTSSFLTPYYEVATAWVQNYSIIYNRVISAKFTNQLAASTSYIQEAFRDADLSFNPVALGLDTGVTSASLIGAPQINIAPVGGESLGATTSGFDPIGPQPLSGRNNITGHLDETVSYLAGRHQIRGGGEYRRVQINEFYQSGQRGTFNFDGAQGPWQYTPGQLLTSCDQLAAKNLGTYAPGFTPGGTANPSIPGSGDPNVYLLADFLAGCVNTSSIVEGHPARQVFMNSFAVFAEDGWQMTRGLNVNYGLRYEYTGPLHDGTKDLTVFDPNVPGGIGVAGSTVGNIYQQFWKGFGPHVGFSYQPQGTNDIVIRGGIGLYYDTPFAAVFMNQYASNGGAFGIQENPAGNNISASTGVNSYVWRSGQPIFPTLANIIAQQQGVVNLFSVQPHFPMSSSYNYNLNIQQSLGKVGIAQIGYVGTQGRHLLDLVDVNQPALGSAYVSPVIGPRCQAQYASAASGNEQCSRPYYSRFPNFGFINQLEDGENSHYDSLQAVWRTQNWRGISAQFSYTWGHALDQETGLTPYLPQDSTNLRAEWGNGDFDVRNQFTGFLTYRLPNANLNSKLLKVFANGWQLNTLLTYRDGEPFTVLAGSDVSGTGENADRADQVGNPFAGVSHKIVNGSVSWFNPAAFAAAPQGTYGTSRRGQYSNPGYSDTDLSVFKNTRISERLDTQLRAEMFNLFNVINLAPIGSPTASMSAPYISSTLGSFYGAPGIGVGEPFNVQLALKLIF